MAKFDRFMIAPINTGLQTDQKPWLIPDDAFAELNNAYVFRSRVRKRFGSRLMGTSGNPNSSRLRMQVGTIGAPVSPVPGSKFNIGQMFSAGTQQFTVYQTGNPAAMLATGPGTGTFSTTTGDFALAGTGLAAGTPIYWYPADPVMGLLTYEDDVANQDPVIGFDTQFAYEYTGNGWERLGTMEWTGDDTQFFWGYTWRGAVSDNSSLYVTNFNPGDFMSYWDGSTWNTLNPVFNAAGDTILTAKLIIPFKGRLLLFNTIEDVSGTPTFYVNRVRWSQNGDPTTTDAFDDLIAGKGGFADATTKEEIVSCEFIKDRVIVYFESSTWELVWTNNQVEPFFWQKINTELGAESTFSIIPFDKVVLGIGNVGIHACNGANVERIDQKIPDTVFQIANNDGVKRVYGIRDYYSELVYWTFPARADVIKFPTRVLVFNYRTGSWAFNTDSFTVFGYFNRQDALTWATAQNTWGSSSATWDSATIQSKFTQVIAGNQQGFVVILDSEENSNAPTFQITDATVLDGVVTITSIASNIGVDINFVKITGVQGLTNLNGNVFEVTSIAADNNSFTILSPTTTGTYTGGGVISTVPVIDILTKQYNFYVNQGFNSYIGKVDFLVDKVSQQGTPLNFNGQITIDMFISDSELSLVDAGTATGALLGTNVLDLSPYALVPFEQTQDRLWHPVYTQAEGECIQLRIYWTAEQMVMPLVPLSNFQLHAMTFYTKPTASRLQ